MAFAGPLIGPAFALEGYAFFIEAIFLGLYLYGWERLPPRGALVVRRGGRAQRRRLGGPGARRQRVDAASRRLHAVADRRAVDVDAWAVFANPAWAPMADALDAVVLPGGRVRGGGRVRLGAAARSRRPTAYNAARRSRSRWRSARSPRSLQPLIGDLLAKRAHARTSRPSWRRPEAQFETQRGAPLRDRRLARPRAPRDALGASRSRRAQLPRRQHDPTTEVLGLDAFPRDQWPNSRRPLAFQVMVGAGFGDARRGALVLAGRGGARAAATTPLPRWLLVGARPVRRRSASSRSRPAGSSPRPAASRG